MALPGSGPGPRRRMEGGKSGGSTFLSAPQSMGGGSAVDAMRRGGYLEPGAACPSKCASQSLPPGLPPSSVRLGEFVITNKACFLSFMTQLTALVSSVISFITLNFY